MFVFLDKLSSKIKKNVLFQYLLTYILVLVVPCLIGCFYYQQTLKIITENAYKENRTLLEQTASSVNKRINEISSITQQLSFSRGVSSFQYSKNAFEYPNSFQVNKTQDELSNYVIANDFIENYFVFFNNSRMVINSKIAYSYEDFYKLYFKNTFENYMLWQETFANATAPVTRKFTLSSEGIAASDSPLNSGNYIFFITPFYSFNTVNGIIVIAVKEENLLALFNEENFSDGGFFYMSSEQNEILVSSSEKETQIAQTQALLLTTDFTNQSTEATIAKQKMIITQLETPGTKYQFVASQPKNTILAKATSIRFILLTILLISIIFSLVISYILAKRNYKTIKQILYHISPDETEGDIFESIKESFNFLSSNNSAMKETLNQQLDILHQVFLGRLINRDLTTEDDIYNMCQCLHFDYKNKLFGLLLFQFDFNVKPGDNVDLTILNSMVELTKEIISQNITEPYFHEPREQELVLLLEGDSTKIIYQKANQIVQQVKSNSPKQIYENLIITGSSFTKNILNISKCFEETHLAFQLHAQDALSTILWYEKSLLKEKVYRFSLADKRQLIYHTKSGNIDIVRNILQQVFTVNLVEKPISTGLQKILLNDLISSLLLSLSEVNLDPQMNETLVQQIESLHIKSELSQIKFITETFYFLCESTKQSSIEVHSQLIDEVLTYLKENYCSPDLSLSYLSSIFNINESYLSYLFKQITNQKFSNYLEYLRLEQAKLLLTQTNKSVNDISSEIGYLSSNSFCRAFKRSTGVTTTAYRNTTI